MSEAEEAIIEAIDAKFQSVEVIDEGVTEGGIVNGIEHFQPDYPTTGEPLAPTYAALYNSEDCTGEYFKIEFSRNPYTDV